jgi:hypothetical protein
MVGVTEQHLAVLDGHARGAQTTREGVPQVVDAE